MIVRRWSFSCLRRVFSRFRKETSLGGLSTVTPMLLISTDLAIQKKPNDDIQFAQTTLALDSSNDPISTRTGVEKGLQASNLFSAKAWFHSSQPMSRSRSSELRCSEGEDTRGYVYEMCNAGAVINSHGIESCLVTMISPFTKEFRLRFRILSNI